MKEVVHICTGESFRGGIGVTFVDVYGTVRQLGGGVFWGTCKARTASSTAKAGEVGGVSWVIKIMSYIAETILAKPWKSTIALVTV
jgi:hypothetical protein